MNLFDLLFTGIFGLLLIYAVLIGIVVFFYSYLSKDQRVAHENLPKTIKYITEGIVTLTIFALMFYLAMNGTLPKDVLITLVSVFSTAGFLSLRNK